MIHIIEFFRETFGSGGNIVVGLIFFVTALLGVIVAIRGRQVMVWLACVCAMIVGILAGAMVGLLVFNSFILMTILAIVGGVALLLLMKYVKALGYFISISALSFFLAFVVTSEMYITDTLMPESTLLLMDLVIAITMGGLSLIKSEFAVSLITSASGGVITAISILGLFGCYFSDWKTWTIAVVVAAAGMYFQIRIYGLGIKRKSISTKRKRK